MRRIEFKHDIGDTVWFLDAEYAYLTCPTCGKATQQTEMKWRCLKGVVSDQSFAAGEGYKDHSYHIQAQALSSHGEHTFFPDEPDIFRTRREALAEAKRREQEDE